jgi:DNA-directed RNA polymerase subunit RPC12/RpoP
LIECPNCGSEVAGPFKAWSMVGRPSKAGQRFKLTLGLFKCPRCERKFRSVLEKEKITIKSIKGIIKETKEIEEEPIQTLRSLRGKIENLESEKKDLLVEIEKLRKIGEEKASTLETDVATLRKEAKSLKKLLGYLE